MAAFMDEVVIDPVSGEQLTPEHAILVPMIDGITNIVDYVKSVGDAVGIKNVRSAYRVNNKVKIYFRFHRHVEEVVHSGINLFGKFASVEYSVPHSTEFTLSNVDSEVPNYVLTEKLSEYGRVVSKVRTLRLPVNDMEFSRIETNVRLVAVRVNPGETMPRVLQVTHCRVEYTVNVSSEPPNLEHLLCCYPECYRNTSTLRHAMMGNSIVNPVLGVDFDMGHSRYSSEHVDQSSTSKKRLHLTTKSSNHKRTKDTPNTSSTSVSCESEQILVTNIPSSPDSLNDDTQNSSIVVPPFEASVASFEIENDQGDRSSQFSVQDQKFVVKLPEPLHNESVKLKTENIKQYPLNSSKLEQFVQEIKNNRNPVGFAFDLLSKNSTPNAINELCEQLIEYHHLVTDVATRARLKRLITLLSDGTLTP